MLATIPTPDTRPRPGRCCGLWRRPLALLALLLLAACAPRLPLPGRSPVEPRPEDRRRALEYFIQAKVYELQGNDLGAIVALRNAADLDQRSPTIYGQLAAAYERTGDTTMALQFAHRALALDPGRTDLRRLAVRLREGSGDRLGAAAELEQLLLHEPSDWRAYRHLAYLYIELGAVDRVAGLFDRLLARPDTPAQVRADLAGILVRIGRLDRAEATFRDLIRQHPEVEDAWLGLAELMLARGRRDDAIALYREAMVRLEDSTAAAYYLARLVATEHDLDAMLVEESPEFLYQLGVALSEAGKYREAAVVFESIVRMRPHTVEGWLDLARHYVHQRDEGQAAAVLERAVAAMPDSTELYLFWGTAMEQADRYEEAVAVYRRGLERSTDHVALYLYWGLALEAQERYAEAREVYGAAQAQLPAEALFDVRQGITLARQERYEEALERYRLALQKDADRVDAHLHAGLALQHLERWDEAIDRLQQAAALDTSGTHALFYLGAALERAAQATGDQAHFDQAAATFRELLGRQPDDAYALNYLGYMFAEAGVNLEEAVVLLQRAVSLDPDNGAFLDSLGWAYFRSGDLARAWEYMQLALANLDPEYDHAERAVILEHAGDVAHARGDQEAARQHWEAALELTPDNAGLREKLRAAPAASAD